MVIVNITLIINILLIIYTILTRSIMKIQHLILIINIIFDGVRRMETPILPKRTISRSGHLTGLFVATNRQGRKNQYRKTRRELQRRPWSRVTADFPRIPSKNLDFSLVQRLGCASAGRPGRPHGLAFRRAAAPAPGRPALLGAAGAGRELLGGAVRAANFLNF